MKLVQIYGMCFLKVLIECHWKIAAVFKGLILHQNYLLCAGFNDAVNKLLLFVDFSVSSHSMKWSFAQFKTLFADVTGELLVPIFFELFQRFPVTHSAMLLFYVVVESILSVRLRLTTIKCTLENLPTVYLHMIIQLISFCPLQKTDAALKFPFLIAMDIPEMAF